MHKWLTVKKLNKKNHTVLARWNVEFIQSPTKNRTLALFSVIRARARAQWECDFNEILKKKFHHDFQPNFWNLQLDAGSRKTPRNSKEQFAY